MPEQSSTQTRPTFGSPLFTGLVVVALFFGLFVGWAAFAPLNSAAIAIGELGVESKRKQIAHLEGGIVVAIEVREGDVVSEGQVLVRFDRTQPQASLALVSGRFLSARALEARLKAERDQLDGIVFAEELLARAREAEVKEMLATQRSIFKARRESLLERQEILRRRIEQYRAEITGLKNELGAQSTHLRLLREEVDAHQALIDKGMASRPRMLELQREAAEIKGTRSRNQAAVARVKQNIAESELEINRLETDRLNEVVQELRETQSRIYDLKEQMRAARDVLDRTEVRAPMAGTVVGLLVHTVGGVVAPGEPLLDIVPADERLIVEARVRPEDIDVVQPGLNAHVRFTAFSSTTHVPLNARVVTVSADRLLDQKTGEPYYSATLVLNEDAAGMPGGEKLYPGMQAEVMIVTGARTPLNYLLEPLLQRINRAFRET